MRLSTGAQLIALLALSDRGLALETELRSMGCSIVGVPPIDPTSKEAALCVSPASEATLFVQGPANPSTAFGFAAQALADNLALDYGGKIVYHALHDNPYRYGARQLQPVAPRDRCFEVHVSLSQFGNIPEDKRTEDSTFGVFVCVFHIDTASLKAARLCSASCAGPQLLYC